MRKGITLVELLVATALVAVIALAAFSLDSVSRNFYVSSQAKADVTNRLLFAVDHIQKKAYRHNGSPAASRVPFSNDGDVIVFSADMGATPTPSDFSDDRVMRYAFDPAVGTLVYCGNWDTASADCVSDRQEVADNVADLSFENMTDATGGVYGFYVNATAYRDLTAHRVKNDGRRNPPIVLNSSVYFEERSSR